MKGLPSRNTAFELLCKYNATDSLIKHALTVEGVMEHFSTLYEDEDALSWGIIGLVHDIDYEQFPDQHCTKADEILRENQWPEEAIRAVKSHGYSICTEIEPLSNLEKVLFTIDELTGLITATTLMRPSKSVLDLEVKSVMKKWKTKTFAAGVNRDLIEQGALRLGMTIEQIIEECIVGMRKIHERIGL